MLFEVPAVPVAAGVAMELLALSFLLLWAVCFGMAQGWKQTLGAALRWMADTIDGLGVHVPHVGHIRPFGPLAAVFRSTDRNVYHAFAWAATKSMHRAAYLFNQSTAMFRYMVNETEALGRALYHHAGLIRYGLLPYWEYKALRLAYHYADRAVHRLRPFVHRLVTRVEHIAAHALARAAHAAHAAEHALDWSAGRFKRLDRRLDREAAKLERLRKHFGALAFAGLVSAALARLGLKWLRCSNNKKALRNTCGMDANLLDSLLLDTVAIVGAISVVEFARELQAVEGDAVKLIRGFIREL